MKKYVCAALIAVIFVFCGCSNGAQGYTGELTGGSWHARLDGGGSISLSFDGDHAALTLENGGESATIRGRVIADDSTFVIFDRELGQNYGFSYVPEGDTMELSYEGNTVIMEREN